MSGGKPEITLAPITRENFRECVGLALASGQEDFVASNVYSIAESKVEPECIPTAVYSEGEIVGFAMYGFQEGKFWIWRFMISAPKQGRGLGRAAMETLIAHIRELPDCDGSISLSYAPENTAAERLYESFGFRKTGKIENREVVSRLEKPS